MGAVRIFRKNPLSGVATVCAVMGSIGVITGSALSADMPLKAPAAVPCIQAVDGINGKVAGLGGSFDSKGIYGGVGSVSMPIACEWGVQFDAAVGSFDSRFAGQLAGHLFWRDPSKALVGLYGSYDYWNKFGGLRANHVGPEAELYMGRFTLQGLAGVEFGNSVTGAVPAGFQTFDVKTRFFDQVNLNYYLQDNFKVFIGHRYLMGKNALALGGEYGIPLGKGVMTSVFAEGRFGEGNFNGVWGGLRFYFGQKDKTLIRRHREDDPTDWGNGFGGSFNNGSTSPSAPTQAPCLPPNSLDRNGVCGDHAGAG